MARIESLNRDELPEYANAFELTESFMGFVPNSLLTMARVPGLVDGFQAMAGAVFGNDLLPMDLKQLIALVASSAAGCQYCQAHTGHGAHRMGVSPEKLDAVWTFESSDLFSEAEKAALALAMAGGQVPNGATDEHFARLKLHWADEQITAMVAVIAMFGYLNRWNDTMATTLESAPIGFGEGHLAQHGWDGAKHR